jgi:predicted Fe-Mo cluster-binding NifX family protein
MRVAMPVWENRISPVLDTARQLLFVEIAQNKELTRRTISLAGLPLVKRIELISDLGLDLFLCGGITRPFYQALINAGIHTIPFVCGNVDHILSSLLDGSKIEYQFAMPGRENRWRHGWHQF